MAAAARRIDRAERWNWGLGTRWRLFQRSINAHDAGPRDAPGVSLAGFLQLGDVRLQFVDIGPADEVQADHFHRPQRRLLSGPERDQHADDDRHVYLYLNAVGPMAQQMTTAQDVLK